MPPLTRRHFIATASGLLLPGASFAAESSVYARRVLEKKPSGYWRLGEKTPGSIADASGNSLHGTFTGTVGFGEKGIFDREKDTAVKFDGSGQGFIEIPDHAALSQPTSGQGFTVEAWMRPDSLEFTGGEGEDGYIHWLGKGEAGSMEWAFRFYPKKSTRPNRISAYIFNPGPGLGSGAYVEEEIKAGKWLHIVATFDPGDKTHPKAGVSLYKDGKLALSPASSPGALYKAYEVVPVHGTAPMRIGTRDKKSFFTGAIDEVAVYPRVLTPREIADNHRAG
ncbi:MAG: LamG domain-containing protein, partial [Prosthecobacter sp.]|nr:LamG domain-containing protein [Prosthecobacter sp.]